MKLYTLLFLFIILCLEKTFAQLKAPAIPSPNAAEIGKYGEVPVNLSTGILNYNIPLVTARSGNLSFPVSLNYSYSGYRPNEEAGWVGRGWNLSAGGVIIRSQRGLPDEQEFNGGSPDNISGGYMVTIDEVNRLYNTVTAYSDGVASFSSLIDGKFDSEPDMFTISCGSLTGKFYFGYTDSTKTQKGFLFTSRRNLKIKCNIGSLLDPAGGNAPRISSFIITDESGTKYYFTQPEFGWQNPLRASENLEYTVSTWHISKIESQSGEKIEFFYKETNPSILKNTPRRQITVLNRSLFGGLREIDLGTCGSRSMQLGEYRTDEIVMSTTEIVLSEIRSRESTIYFTSSNLERKVILSEPGLTSYYHKLSKIEQKNLIGNSVLAWKFKYNDSLSVNNEFLLKSLQEVIGVHTKPPYKFNYYSENAILAGIGSDLYYKSFAIDRWDYYNQVNNKTPTVNSLLESKEKGAVRISVLEPTKFGALEKINYPTGGFTKFDYELNSYSRIPGEITTVWNPVSSSEISVTPDNIYELEDYFEKNTGFFFNRQGNQWMFEEQPYPALFPFTPNAPTQCVVTFEGQSSNCGVETSSCDFCCEVNNFGAQTLELQAGIQYGADYFLPPSLKEKIMSQLDTNARLRIILKLSTKKNILNAPSIVAGGIRIKEVKNFASDSVLVNTKSYKYERKDGNVTKSSGQIYRRPKYWMNNFQAFIRIPPSGAGFSSNDTISIRIWENSSLVNTLQSFSSSYVLYEQVQEYLNGELFNEYFFSNINDYKLRQNASFMGSLETTFTGNSEIADFAVGIQNKKVSYKTTNAVRSPLMSEINNYKTLVNLKSTKISSPAINMQIMGHIGYPTCIVDAISTTIVNVDSPIFSMRKYNVDSYRFDLVSTQKVEVISQSPNVQIEQLTEYFPSPKHYLPYKSRTTNSDGSIDEIISKKPLDYISTSNRASWITAMIDSNIVAPVIEQQLFKTRGTNKKVTGAKLTVYKKNSSGLVNFSNMVPDKDYAFESAVPLDTVSNVFFNGTTTAIDKSNYPKYRQVISYDAFDKYSNLAQATSVDGIPTTYLWAYMGNYQVATIKNAYLSMVNNKIGANFVDLTNNGTISNLLNIVRTDMKSAFVESAVYKPLIGIDEQTDPSGLKTTYVYDELNRLSQIKDNDNKLVKSYKYNYQTPDASSVAASGQQVATVNFTGQLDVRSKEIALAFSCSNTDVARYEIRRGYGNEPLKHWVTVSGKTRSKIDPTYTPQKSTYKYEIRGILNQGVATDWKALNITLPANCNNNFQIIKNGLVSAGQAKSDKACYEVIFEEGFITADNAEYTAEIETP